MKNKRGVIPIVAILAVAVVVGYLVYSGVISTGSLSGTGSYIERPVFYYDKCEAVASLQYSSPSALANAGQWIEKPSVTNYYNVQITPPASNFVGGAPYTSYSVCNSQVNSKDNCRIFNQIQQTTNVIRIDSNRNNEYVYVHTYFYYLFSIHDNGGATYQVGFIPYGIRQYNVLGGSPAKVNPNSCTYPTAQTDSLIATDSQKINDAYRGVDKSTNQNVLQPEEVRWYVAGYLTSAAPSFALNYKGQEAWCRPNGQSAEIYKINKVTVGTGTYKIASVDYSDKIGDETCCPGQVQGDKTCNNNFAWGQTAGSECSAFKSCGSPNWVPYSEKVLVKYSCVNGYCKSQTKSVNCASDYDCKDSNQVCNLNTYNCVNANVNLNGQVIKTIPDNAADCEVKGGKWVTSKTTQNTGMFCIASLGLGLCSKDVVVNEYCDLSSPNYISWAVILVAILVLLYFGRGFILEYLNLLLAWAKIHIILVTIIVLIIIIFFGGFKVW